MSDNRLTLKDFLSRTFPFALLARGQAYLYPWSGEGSSSWEYHITLRLNRGLQAPENALSSRYQTLVQKYEL